MIKWIYEYGNCFYHFIQERMNLLLYIYRSSCIRQGKQIFQCQTRLSFCNLFSISLKMKTKQNKTKQKIHSNRESALFNLRFFHEIIVRHRYCINVHFISLKVWLSWLRLKENWLLTLTESADCNKEEPLESIRSCWRIAFIFFSRIFLKTSKESRIWVVIRFLTMVMHIVLYDLAFWLT